MEILTEAAKQLPALCVMVYLVLRFLKFVEARDKLLSEISDKCHAQQAKATEAIKENSTAMGRMCACLNNCESCNQGKPQKEDEKGH